MGTARGVRRTPRHGAPPPWPGSWCRSLEGKAPSGSGTGPCGCAARVAGSGACIRGRRTACRTSRRLPHSCSGGCPARPGAWRTLCTPPGRFQRAALGPAPPCGSGNTPAAGHAASSAGAVGRTAARWRCCESAGGGEFGESGRWSVVEGTLRCCAPRVRLSLYRGHGARHAQRRTHPSAVRSAVQSCAGHLSKGLETLLSRHARQNSWPQVTVLTGCYARTGATQAQGVRRQSARLRVCVRRGCCTSTGTRPAQPSRALCPATTARVATTAPRR